MELRVVKFPPASCYPEVDNTAVKMLVKSVGNRRIKPEGTGESISEFKYDNNSKKIVRFTQHLPVN
jgi:hypothetical protein